MVIDDFNAKIEKRCQYPTARPHGICERNERSDSLVEWYTENNLNIMNTWFKNHERCLYTWKSSGDQTRNQIDFIITNRRFRNSIKSCKPYPGAKCNSDHNLLMVKLAYKLKKLEKPKGNSCLDTRLLIQEPVIAHQFKIEMRNRFDTLRVNENSSGEQDWFQLEDVLTKSAKQRCVRNRRRTNRNG